LTRTRQSFVGRTFERCDPVMKKEDSAFQLLRG
jgi:hypothetical protein